ncbi:cell division protein ZapE [Cellulosimicrobium arenosum]|uniref:Cell division protein ZapE n=1 Tax=Cellulosimicrobium arenosum TaxID=2708133 RepID=A0A927J0D1_9MICO|nr:cell division protein ZapE [Cellulosimicrobium arenosum]
MRDAVAAAAAREGFALDPAQESVLDRLLVLAVGLRTARRRGLRGLYVWGPAGRGKSWLVGAFFAALVDGPTAGAARRVHVYELFRELHAAIHAQRVASWAAPRPDDAAQPPPRATVVDAAIDDLLRGTRVLYLDELHLHDTGDATLLTRLLRRAFSARVVVVATSNYEPGTLLPNPLWHHLAEPGIELLQAHLDVVELAGTTDYRSWGGRGRSGFAGGSWVSPGAPAQLAALGLRAPAAGERTTVRTGSRTFAVSAARDGELWTTFADLAARATSTLEYLDWASRFRRWVVTDVPLLPGADREAQQRFIAVVDVLCDADVELVVTSAHDRDAFLAAMPDRPDAFRMASRLTLLARIETSGKGVVTEMSPGSATIGRT